jgi:YNFM family putative membrane transporter
LFAFCLFAGQAVGVTAAGYSFDHWGAVPLLAVPAMALTLAGSLFARALERREPD